MYKLQWTKGFTASQLGDLQSKYDLVFPPDLPEIFREKRPITKYDWFDEIAIRKILNWPFEALLFDVEYNQLWWPEWGLRPENSHERKSVLKDVVSMAPKLIPIIGHRFLPETPTESNNPIFSVHGADTICYGANLEDFFARESNGWNSKPWPTDVKHIPFWSDLVDRNS